MNGKTTSPARTARTTMADVRRRKEAVLAEIRKEQGRIRFLSSEMTTSWQQPLRMFSLGRVKQVSGLVSGAYYAYKVVKTLSKATKLWRR